MTTHAMPMSWKDLYDRAESLWTQPLQAAMSTESALRLMGLTREQTLTQQAAVRDGWETYWRTLRLPTKSDHATLAGQVVALEAKVDSLADSLEAIEGRLDAVLGQLEALHRALAASAPSPESPAAAPPAARKPRS